jgi:hypothetical protein
MVLVFRYTIKSKYAYDIFESAKFRYEYINLRIAISKVVLEMHVLFWYGD